MKAIPVKMIRHLLESTGKEGDGDERFLILRAELVAEADGELGFRAGAEGIVTAGVRGSLGGSGGRRFRRAGDNDLVFGYWSPSAARVEMARRLIEAGIETGNAALAKEGVSLLELPQAFDAVAVDSITADFGEDQAASVVSSSPHSGALPGDDVDTT